MNTMRTFQGRDAGNWRAMAKQFAVRVSAYWLEDPDHAAKLFDQAIDCAKVATMLEGDA